MKFASPILGFFTIILLVALPVGGNPNLSVGSKATYNLKAAISFPPIRCYTSSPLIMQGGLNMCPYVASIPLGINITGTIGWTATGLNSTTAVLNVTRDLTISHDDLMTPSFHSTGSFNESVNLATRIISITPFLRTEMDAAVQSALSSISASVPSGVDPSLAISTIEPTIGPRAVYTMWWVNGTLHEGEKVPILFFQTNVTGSTSINLGGLGTRDAWTLVYNVTKPFPMPLTSTASTSYPTWIGTFERVLTFNYDQKSGLLLSATANIHTGFELVEPPCNTSMTSAGSALCDPSTATPVMVASCGFDLSASLTLAGTSLNLDQTMPSTSSSSGGNTGGSGSSGGGGSGGSGNPGSSAGGSSGGNSGPNGGSSPNNNGGTGGSGSGAGSPSSSPSSAQPSPTASSPGSLLYLIVGLVAVAIVVASILFVRRRNGKSQQQTSGQPTN